MKLLPALASFVLYGTFAFALGRTKRRRDRVKTGAPDVNARTSLGRISPFCILRRVPPLPLEHFYSRTGVIPVIGEWIVGHPSSTFCQILNSTPNRI